MNITAESVRVLREQTGAGMMDCKSALVEAQGDMNKAQEVLRKKGLAAAAKRAGRTASEGMIGHYIHPGAKVGVLVEIDCETDFVAKNEDFQTMVRDIAMHIAAASPTYVTKEEVPQAIVDKEKEIYRAQAIAAGKPEAVADKIAEGKLKDFYATQVLLEQAIEILGIEDIPLVFFTEQFEPLSTQLIDYRRVFRTGKKIFHRFLYWARHRPCGLAHRLGIDVCQAQA